MKTHVLMVVLLSLAGACASSTPDRRSTKDERQAVIDRYRDHAQAQAQNREETRENMADDRADATSDPSDATEYEASTRASDIDITQAIRKAVIADDELSFNAKNVKIMTVSGKVTLRGRVASTQESSAIETSARAIPGVVQVDNQIEVKR